MKRLLIISPDAELMLALQGSLSSVKTVGRGMILRNYPHLKQLAALLRTKPPLAVIVSLSEPERALQLIREFNREFPHVPVVAAHTCDSDELIGRAMRSGASDYIGPPFPAGYLERGLVRRWPLRAREARLGKPQPAGRSNLVVVG